jgi:hypothetical protein
VAAVFVGATVAWSYLGPGLDGAGAVVFVVVFAVAHILCGFGVGSWFVLFVPAVVALLLVPLPQDGEFPAWFGYLAFAGIPGIALLSTGVGLRRLRDRRA